jgi:molybdopterin-guanine dinucleotide biosynthesis protein A
LDRTAIILTAGSSKGFNCERGTLEIDGKPLINRVIDAVKFLVKEIIVVTNSQECADSYTKIVKSEVKFVIDTNECKGPLVEALTGFEATNSEYSALLTVDSPFVSSEVLSLLFDCGVGKAATIPRWTNQEIEPLHAVYHTKQALEAAKDTVAENDLDVEAMVDRLHGVRYISTMVIEQLDPDLKTFFTINTPLDLKKAQVMLKPRIVSKDNRKQKW